LAARSKPLVWVTDSPYMTPDQIALVQESWKTVADLGDPAIEAFYDKLFEMAPAVRALFTDDLTEQRKKLRSTLAVAVAGLTKLDEIVPVVAALGEKHVAYGAQPAHYAVVGEALLATLASAFANQWNDDLQDAWAEAYALLASVMIDAAAKKTAAA
jgi:hemoglobin-like flavoprotein